MNLTNPTMAAKELFEHESILRLIEELKTDGVKFDKRDPLFDYAEYMDRRLGDFREATGADEALLFDILKNDRADLYNYIFHQGYDKGVFGLVMPLMHLIDFAVLRHFPDKLEDFMSRFLYSKAPKEARKRIKRYNKTFGIVPEKPKKASVPKPRAVTPAIEPWFDKHGVEGKIPRNESSPRITAR